MNVKFTFETTCPPSGRSQIDKVFSELSTTIKIPAILVRNIGIIREKEERIHNAFETHS